MFDARQMGTIGASGNLSAHFGTAHLHHKHNVSLVWCIMCGSAHLLVGKKAVLCHDIRF